MRGYDVRFDVPSGLWQFSRAASDEAPELLMASYDSATSAVADASRECERMAHSGESVNLIVHTVDASVLYERSFRAPGFERTTKAPNTESGSVQPPRPGCSLAERTTFSPT